MARPRQPPPGLEPGALFAFRRDDGRYGALQILDARIESVRDKVLVAELDGVWKSMPTAKQAISATVRLDDEGVGVGPRPQWVFARAQRPWWATPIGVEPPVTAYDPGFVAVGDNWPREHREPAETLAITRSGDYRRNKATYLDVTVHGSMTIRVGHRIRGITVRGDHGKLAVLGVRAEFPFALALAGKRVTSVPSGFTALEQLSVEAPLIDGRAVAALPNLRWLRLDGERGKLVHAKALRGLRGLRELVGCDVYDYDAAAFPTRADWPELDVLYLRWLRRSDADAIKKKLAGAPWSRVLFTRSDAEIAEAADNPFRDWADEDEGLGRAAAKLWKQLRATRRRGEPVVRDLLVGLNRLDAKYDLETEQREQAADAIVELGKRVGVPRRRAMAIFDELREF